MSTARRIHIANSSARNATVSALSVNPELPQIVMGVNGQEVEFKRYVAAGSGKLHDDLASQFGGDYAQQLVDGDPEIDFEVVGRIIEGTQSLLLSSKGEPLYVAPKVVEITLSPEGGEISRRDPVDVAATVNDDIPLRWTGKKLPKGEVVRKFQFKRTMQLGHVDGISFDFLYGMAKELDETNSMVLLGAGDSGKDPLIMQMNGSPYRGFLEGRIDGEKYILLLHLSNMELKVPSKKESKTEAKVADE